MTRADELRALIVDAYLLGTYYDYEPDMHEEPEAEFLSKIRHDYPEHVDDGERVAARVLALLQADQTDAGGRDA